MIEIKHRYTGEVLRAYDGANLYGADLRGADLRDANLSDASLHGADLRGADLRDANLYGADLRGADLRGADLRDANLSDASLSDASLRGASLRGAVLYGANLTGANLTGAHLRGANLTGAEGLGTFIVAPREGALIGWKKCRNGVIVKLSIPADARRVNCIGSRKCRAEFADVLEVFGADVGIGQHDFDVRYVAGQRVTPDSYDDSDRAECSHGIHFFISRAEAEEY